MADNTQLSVPVGSGDVVRDKDRSGVKTQIVGLDIGIGGATETLMQAGQQAMAASLPVVIASNQTAVPVDSELPAAAALGDNTANPTAPAVASFPHLWDGAAWDRAPGTSADGLLVNLGANNDVTVTGTVTVTASNLQTNLAQYGGSAVGAANALHVQPGTGAVFSVTVSGTVTADTELPAAAALADNTANPTTPSVGSFPHWFDGTTWDRARGDSADGLLVNLGANNDVTVTGSVTANAGTNLNTSALALESGGNLAAAAASLGVMDDWDESDRAKVNPIAGQAGVQGGSGLVSALTQRVVLATDVALPAGTNAIGKLAANSGVDIGDVDVTSISAGDNVIGRVKLTDGTLVASVRDTGASDSLNVAIVDGSGNQITTFGGGTQYTEADTDATITGTAILWEDASDTLRAVSAAKPLPVNIISGAGSGGTAIADGAAFTPDTTSLTPVGGYRDDTTPATVTEGDAAAARITEYRALHVNLRDASGNEVSVGGGTQYDEDTAHSSGDKLTMAGAVRRDTPASSSGTDGDRSTLNVDANGRLYTNENLTQVGGAAIDVNSGSKSGGTIRMVIATDQPQLTNPLLVTASQATAASLNATAVGAAAHDAAAAGNPLLLGAYASAAAPSDVSTDADAVRLWALRNGSLAVTLTAAGALVGGDATNGIDVDVTRVTGTVTVGGVAAHDAAVSGNPVLLAVDGRRARPAAVSTDGDVTRMAGDRYGRVQTVGVELSVASIQATASGNTSLIAAPGASTRIKLLRVYLSNSHASTALTVGINTASILSGATFNKCYLPAAGGAAVINFPNGYLLCGVNELVNLNLSGAGQVEATAYYEPIAD